ncbi:MAG: hypothetical protein JWQ32_922 [Marmoricola sp.]|nr:hypothetical protein [Marmoricola sp.]
MQHLLRRPSPARAAGVAVSAVLLLGVGACGDGAVHVDGFDSSAADRAACATLIASVPANVGNQRRHTTSGSPYAAAWGDPAIVLRCGVGTPAEFTRFSACQRVNGVDWFAPDRMFTDQSSDVLLTTIGRSPRVEVLVPARYRPPLATMVDLAPTILAHTREMAPCS